MNKYIIIGIAVCLAIGLFIAGYIVAQPAPVTCMVPNEIAQNYLLNCQSIDIEGVPYTLCQQNLAGTKEVKE